MSGTESDEVDRALAEHPGWRREGEQLIRELPMRDFDAAFELVGRVAAAAVDHFRRPDMCISEFNRVRLIVANPHHAGVTLAEVRLVERVDGVLATTERSLT